MFHSLEERINFQNKLNDLSEMVQPHEIDVK